MFGDHGPSVSGRATRGELTDSTSVDIEAIRHRVVDVPPAAPPPTANRHVVNCSPH